MKKLTITTISELNASGLEQLMVVEDIAVEIKLTLYDETVEFPMNIVHSLPGRQSSVTIRAALYGKSNLVMPVEILVKEGAIDTSTGFKALVYIMSPKSSAKITPGLLIHEKNIQSASHGVVIKNIKAKDIVYLQARGIEEKMAKKLLIGI